MKFGYNWLSCFEEMIVTVILRVFGRRSKTDLDLFLFINLNVLIKTTPIAYFRTKSLKPSMAFNVLVFPYI